VPVPLDPSPWVDLRVHYPLSGLRTASHVHSIRPGLARTYALSGDTVKAKSAYQDFLALWKDADPDIPVLIAAKSEYAKLK
jgi:hypothetical protein